MVFKKKEIYQTPAFRPNRFQLVEFGGLAMTIVNINVKINSLTFNS
jgi:hypothetical protein